MSNAPVHKARSGAVKAAVWANEYEVEGAKRTGHSVKIERSYKDKDGEWKDTDKLNAGDVGDAIAVLQNVQQWLIKTD